ncbi:phosphopentomutase-like [Watersipora subatra]|uniref:phosphopentomutase-like n=1 Tax=Watersipora subatra TaxID=2589382 RepID=UPI00355B637C
MMAEAREKALLLNSKIEEWMLLDRNETTRAEVHKLVTDGNASELEKRFLQRIAFGTAGLRAKMAAGFTMMNDVVVIQTAQGLSSYLLKVLPEVKQKGVVVGFDGRHNSNRWGHFTAAAMLRKDIPVHLFADVVPTPYVAFAVKHLNACCGVVVTASHNPKDDNGYKVYWNRGAQIVPPLDEAISEHIIANCQLDDASWDISKVLSHPLRMDPTADIDKAYFAELSSYVHYKEQNSTTDIQMVYTALHGVGWRCVQMAVELFGFKPCIPVKEQADPDPDFPTVPFPNPEEGKSALSLAMKTAEENNVQLVIANDPDADRMCFAEKNASSGEWKIFNGNEIGTLLCWWCWHCFKLKNPEETGQSVYTLSSTVSSKICRTIAETEGFNFVETLTGFKWMGNKAIDLEEQGKTILFSFEEAIGFMVGNLNYDKDGISALGMLYELAAYLHREGKQLHEQLGIIFEKYGHHISLNSYYFCHDKETILKIFERMRSFDGEPSTYPKEFGGVKVKYVRDLTAGYDNEQPDNNPILPVSSASQMITLTFDNNVVMTIRTSGTEPKIKYYSEIQGKGLSEEEAKDVLTNLVHAVVEELLQPEINQLIPKSE